MTELTPEVLAAWRKLSRLKALRDAVTEQYDAAFDEFEALLPLAADQSKRGRGRPQEEATSEQQLEVLRLHHANGRIGVRAISDRLGLGRRAVQRIIDESDAASRNYDVSSRNSSLRDLR